MVDGSVWVSSLLGMGVGGFGLGFLGQSIAKPIAFVLGILAGLLLVGFAFAPLGFGGLLAWIQSWPLVYAFIVGVLGGGVLVGWVSSLLK